MAQDFEVFRMEKLKNAGAMIRALNHDLDLSFERKSKNEKGEEVTETLYYRKTRNPEFAEKNQYQWRFWTDENGVKHERTKEQQKALALKKWRERLPENRRKDAVLGAQCLFSYSHDFKISKVDYFNSCLDFCRKHFGKENLINWSVHYDETTPHITVQFVPLVDGKLNAKKIFGNKKTLSEWQDKFHEEVGQKFGLERGVKKTNLSHKELRRFYGELKNLDRDLEKWELPKRDFLESAEDYSKRWKLELKKFVEPMLKPLADLQSKVKKFETEKMKFEQQLTDEINKKLEKKYSVEIQKAENLDRFLRCEKSGFQLNDGRKLTLNSGVNSIFKMDSELSDIESLTPFGLRTLAEKCEKHGFETVLDAKDFMAKNNLSSVVDIPKEPKKAQNRSYSGWSR